MRKIICIALLFAILLLTLPLLAVKSVKEKEVINTGGITSPYENPKKAENFRVLMADSKKIVVMSAEDYIFGVVAAEMPALYDIEALKAQAVAAYSFACVRRAQNGGLDYDISTDPTLDQSYISKDDAREKWGENWSEYQEKISNAVKSVSGKTVMHNGKIALTLYHAISGGKTESSADIWGGEYEYLVSVDSVWDKLSPDYIHTVSFTTDELKELLGDYNFETSNIKTTATANGTVKTLIIDGKELSGEELRKKLSLRSLNFTFKAENKTVTFETKGYGHSVGMSQYGADYMAKQGSNYIEILKHYYKNVTIE